MHLSGNSKQLAHHGTLGSFTVDVPKSVGLYWAWQPDGCFPCLGQTHMVEVSRLEAGQLMVSVPGCSYRDSLSDISRTVEADSPWFGVMWLGPVVPPQVHVDDSAVTEERAIVAPALERAWEALPLSWRAHPGLKALIQAARHDIEVAQRRGASVQGG